jgi:LysM repeat protein
MGTYARRSPLRFLAPVALVIFGLALLTIVSTSNGGDENDEPSASEREKARDLGAAERRERRARRNAETEAGGGLPTKTYTVKSGDTLGSISEKTGIPVEKLQELNPELDPQQLVSGQKIKLRE